jgi:hypothetical protein
MTEFVITENIQNHINYFRSFPETFLSVTAGPPSSELIFPDTLINPVMFTFRIYNNISGNTADVKIVIPEELYNQGVVDYGGAEIAFLKEVVNYNAPHTDNGGISDGCILCPEFLSFWINPVDHKFVPILGHQHTPVDQTTVHPMLQVLLEKIKQIPGIISVSIYEYIDPARLEIMQTDHAYKCYCYFGESTGPDGFNNVATALPSNVYTDEQYHEPTIQNIKTLLATAILTQQG